MEKTPKESPKQENGSVGPQMVERTARKVSQRQKPCLSFPAIVAKQQVPGGRWSSSALREALCRRARGPPARAALHQERWLATMGAVPGVAGLLLCSSVQKQRPRREQCGQSSWQQAPVLFIWQVTLWKALFTPLADSSHTAKGAAP